MHIRYPRYSRISNGCWMINKGIYNVFISSFTFFNLYVSFICIIPGFVYQQQLRSDFVSVIKLSAKMYLYDFTHMFYLSVESTVLTDSKPVDTTCVYIEARLFVKANNYYKMMTFFIFVIFLPFYLSPFPPSHFALKIQNLFVMWLNVPCAYCHNQQICALCTCNGKTNKNW